MYNNEDITLDQVRIILEQLARESQRNVEDVTIRDTIEVLKRGSNGTVGAYVKQVKREHILAERYDMKDIAPQLKAAIVSEIDRFVKNSEEVSSKLVKALDCDHKEVCKDNDGLHQEIKMLNKALEEVKTVATTQDNKLTGELATERQMSEGLKGEKSKLESEVERLNIELSNANGKAEDQAKYLGNLEATLKEEGKRSQSLLEEASNVGRAREEAEKRASLAEQKVGHHEGTINRLEIHCKALDATIKIQASKIEAQDAQLIDLSNKLLDFITTRQDNGNNKQATKGKRKSNKAQKKAPTL